MKLLIFLGNPGIQYEKTRHNIWFIIGDELAYRRNCEIRKTNKEAKALISSTLYDDEKILLVKPQTYMNLSGQSVSFLQSFYKVDLKDIILIHDDIDLPTGTIRYKFGGSSGGQNGIKDTIIKLGNDQFARIKVGIGRPLHPDISIADYVLGKLNKEELDNIHEYTNITINKLNKHFFNK